MIAEEGTTPAEQLISEGLERRNKRLSIVQA
jgi:hypothetical protein